MSFRTADGTATTGDGDYAAKTGTLTVAPRRDDQTITIEVKGTASGRPTSTVSWTCPG